MSKATPGPWEACKGPAGSFAIFGPNVRDIIAHVPPVMPAETVAANAALIASAPNLLSACRAAADLLLRCDGERMPSDLTPASDEDWDRVVEQLEQAVKAAEVGNG